MTWAPRWTACDVVLVVALACLVALLVVLGADVGAAKRSHSEEAHEQQQPGPCSFGDGPCGCVPVHGPCRMPCAGCCPGGCKPQEPPPTSAQ